MTRSELWYKVSRSIHNAARLSHDAMVDEIVALVDAYEPPRTVICKPAQGEGAMLVACEPLTQAELLVVLGGFDLAPQDGKLRLMEIAEAVARAQRKKCNPALRRGS